MITSIPAPAISAAKRRPVNPLSWSSAPILRRGRGQVGADLALIGGRGRDGPGADDAPARVGADGQAEAVEPFGVRAVAAEPGGQVVAGAGPLVWAADPGGVLDRERGGVDLLDRVGGNGGGPGGAELLEGAP